MKKILFLFLLFQVTIGFAQRPAGGRSPQRVNSQPPLQAQPQMQKFEASKLAGVIEYDLKKTLKKLKIKKSDSLADKTTKAITTFNSQTKSIAITNKDLFEGLDVLINQNIEAAIKNRNREAARAAIELAREKIMPIRTKITEHETTLNTTLANILSEEQYKKWGNYQKAEKEKLMPKKSKRIDPRDRPSTKANSRGVQGIGR